MHICVLFHLDHHFKVPAHEKCRTEKLDNIIFWAFVGYIRTTWRRKWKLHGNEHWNERNNGKWIAMTQIKEPRRNMYTRHSLKLFDLNQESEFERKHTHTVNTEQTLEIEIKFESIAIPNFFSNWIFKPPRYTLSSYLKQGDYLLTQTRANVLQTKILLIHSKKMFFWLLFSVNNFILWKISCNWMKQFECFKYINSCFHWSLESIYEQQRTPCKLNDRKKCILFTLWTEKWPGNWHPHIRDPYELGKYIISNSGRIFFLKKSDRQLTKNV